MIECDRILLSIVYSATRRPVENPISALSVTLRQCLDIFLLFLDLHIVIILERISQNYIIMRFSLRCMMMMMILLMNTKECESMMRGFVRGGTISFFVNVKRIFRFLNSNNFYEQLVQQHKEDIIITFN